MAKKREVRPRFVASVVRGEWVEVPLRATNFDEALIEAQNMVKEWK